MSWKIKVFVFIFSLITGIGNNFAQTKNEAVEAYNMGLSMMKTDPEAALESLNKAIEISEQLGAEGEETREMAEALIPGIHYQIGVNLYKKKELLEAAEQFERTVEVAEEFGDTQTKEKAARIVPQLYFAVGNGLYKADQFDSALVYFNLATEADSNYEKAYFGKALTYRKMEDTENFLEAIDNTIEAALQSNKDQIATKAEETARDYLLIRGQKAVQAKSYEEASGLLEKVVVYDPDSKEAFYLLGLSHNALKNWSKSMKAINKAIDLETGTGDDLAKLYYELGTAYYGLGDNEAACEAYSKAAEGGYKQSAEYQMKHVVKCN